MEVRWNDGGAIRELPTPDALRAIRRGYAVRVEVEVKEPEPEPEPETDECS